MATKDAKEFKNPMDTLKDAPFELNQKTGKKCEDFSVVELRDYVIENHAAIVQYYKLDPKKYNKTYMRSLVKKDYCNLVVYYPMAPQNIVQGAVAMVVDEAIQQQGNPQFNVKNCINHEKPDIIEYIRGHLDLFPQFRDIKRANDMTKQDLCKEILGKEVNAIRQANIDAGQIRGMFDQPNEREQQLGYREVNEFIRENIPQVQPVQEQRIAKKPTLIKRRQNLVDAFERLNLIDPILPPPITNGDKSYYLDGKCNDKDVEFYVKHFIKYQNYLPQYSIENVKKMTKQQLCDILLKPKQIIQKQNKLNLTLLSEIANLFEEFMYILCVYLEFLILPQSSIGNCRDEQGNMGALSKIIEGCKNNEIWIPKYATYGIRPESFEISLENLNAGIIGNPVINGTLIDHIFENILPYERLNDIKIYMKQFPNEGRSFFSFSEVPELFNKPESIYTNGYIQQEFLKHVNPELINIIKPLVKNNIVYKDDTENDADKYISYFNLAAYFKIRQYLQSYLYFLVIEKYETIQNKNIKSRTPIINFNNNEIILRNKNELNKPEISILGKELNIENKLIKAYAWLIASGTDWLHKKIVDEYDIDNATRILLGKNSPLYKELINTQYTHSLEESLKTIQTYFYKDSLEINEAPLKKLTSYIDKIKNNHEQYLHRINIFARTL